VCIGPLANTKPVVWGWDLAKSVDWTVGIALDAKGRVCRLERFQMHWRVTKAAIKRVTKAPAAIDSTGVGDPIVEELQHDLRTEVEGFWFTSKSKQQLMEGLSAAISEGGIHYPDGVIVSELESFEYEYTRTGVRYSAPEGLHDDVVCALALAVHKLRKPRQPWRPL